MRRSNSSRMLQNNKTLPAIIPNWSQIKSPSSVIPRRAHHTSVLYNNCLYIYGGYENSNGTLSDLMKFQTGKEQQQSWIKIDVQSGNKGPQGRHSHSAVVRGDRMFVYGGLKETIHSCAQLWVYEFKENVWMDWTYKIKGTNTQLAKDKYPEKSFGRTPGAIDSHQAVLWNQNQMVVHGGFSQGKVVGSIWSLDLDNLQWNLLFDQEDPCHTTGLTYPQPRSNHSLNINHINSTLLLFGGSNMDTKFNDLWQFSMTNFKWTKLNPKNPPLPRSGHASVLYNSNLVVFGGIKGITHQLNDLVYYKSDINDWKVIWADTQSSSLEIFQEKAQKKKRKASRQNQYQTEQYYGHGGNQLLLNSTGFVNNPNRSYRGFVESGDNTMNSTGFQPKWNVIPKRVKPSQRSTLSSNYHDIKVFTAEGKRIQFPKINQNPLQSKKYRTALKSVNYYNNNVPEMMQRQKCKRTTMGKNILMNLLKMTDSKLDNSQHTPKHSSSMQNLTNSIMFTISRCINNTLNKSRHGTHDWSNSATVSGRKCQTPRARDGHSCTLLDEKFLLIFGGDQHMMANNSIILVDLENIIRITEDSQNSDSDSHREKNDEGQFQREKHRDIRVEESFRLNKTITILKVKSKNK